jgi:hypothetical protein
MTTEAMEQATTEAEVTPTGSDRHPMIAAVIAVAALLVGFLAGWVLWGPADASDGADVVVVGGGELTDRQEEMLRVADEAHGAIIEGDGDALAALFVPQGYLRDPGHNMELRVDDGSLASQINAGPAPSYQVDEPIVVHGDMVISTGSWGDDVVHVFLFTPGGDVRIITDTLVW